MSEPILRVEGLRKSFGTLEVLKGVHLEVRPGEVVVIIGPSGCGKSTLLRCVNCLEQPTAGQVRFRGETVGFKEAGGQLVPRPEQELDAQRTRVGMVFQRFNLFPHMTAPGNVIEAPLHVKRLPRGEAEELGRGLLARVGLLDKKDEYPHRLSGGQQQRVAIARALAMQPKLMLFDEPTSALDPELVGEVLDVMRELAQSGMTMIVVTHEIGFAREAGDALVFMDEGFILEAGHPREVITNPQHERTQQFLSKVL